MIPWSRSTSNGSLRGPRSPESGAQVPQIIYSDWGTKLAHLGPLLLRRVQLLTNLNQGQTRSCLLATRNTAPNISSPQFITIARIQNIWFKTFHNVCWRFRNVSITKPMSRTVGRPRQHLHDNKTNCSLECRIQTYFSIYTALLALTLILQKKSFWKKYIWNFLSGCHNIRGETGRQQVCGRDPIETNFQSAICLLLVLVEGRLRNLLTKLPNSGTFPAYYLSATCVDLSWP